MNISQSRKRVGVIIEDSDNNSILLMYRYKNGMEYYCAIGGGIEVNEDPKSASIREVFEESNLNILGNDLTLITQMQHPEIDQYEYFFMTNKFKGVVKLGSPELDLLSKDNIFKPTWVKKSIIDSLQIFPNELKQKLILLFK